MSFQADPETVGQPTGGTTRKVVAGHFVSVDGVAEAPDRFITAWDDETDASGADLIATQDAVILGRRSYDEWAGFWPGSDIEPFASFINAVPKYVATSTPLEREWANSHRIDGGLVDFVQHLKAQPGGDIGVHASLTVTRALLAAGVVDELRLVVLPTIVGNGHRLFDGLPPLRLETIRGTASPSGHLLVAYRVAHQ
jgi:dihydrofolate reductase